MTAAPNLITVDDLSVAQILELFSHAKAFGENPRGFADLARGHLAASLFYEPSTRTRLSFESAMQRLGGGVVTAADMRASSATKGESLADTVRVVSAYADLIVLRHPSEGAAELASRYARVPVVNAGDGSHEHPTQTLCDLYTLWIEKGGIEGLDVVLAGDLRYSRTIHSFVYALARFGANLVCVPQPGLELPHYVVSRLRQEYGAEPVRADASALGALAGESDVVYLTPQKPHQLSLFTDADDLRVGDVDAVYMTRPQTERHGEGDAGDEAGKPYMRLGQDAMSAGSLKRAVVMHPLPRRDEISEELDDDPRARYFEQAARGVPIRMAILAFLLGRIELEAPPHVRPDLPVVKLAEERNPCANPTCVSHTERRHRELFCFLTSRDPLRAVCGYCHQELPFAWVGSSRTKAFHAPDAEAVRRLRPDQLVFLRSEDEARELGFEPAQS